MKSLDVNCCRNCPFYDGSDHEFAICGHSDAPKGAYKAIVNRSHWQPDPIPIWCPIKDGTIKVERNSRDKIVSQTRIIITGKFEE